MARRSLPRRFLALAVATLTAALAATVATTGSWAAPGGLDPSFGSGGTVTTPGMGSASALVRQPDGKLVTAGTRSSGGSWHFALARYDAGGALDPGFGSSGIVTTPIGPRSQANALVLQPDGKLVASGLGAMNVDGSNGVLTMARYNPDGTLDGTFGTNGIAKTSLASNSVNSDLLLQPDGRLVVVGTTRLDGTDRSALARYDRNGLLDPSFGSGGTVTTLAGFAVYATAGALQADGKLIAVGSAQHANGGFGITRYNHDGSLDTTFGSGGTVTTRIGSVNSAWANDVIIEPDGKLLVGGKAERTDPTAGPSRYGSYAVARYNPDGSLDTSFGSSGIATTPIGSYAEVGALVQEEDGRLILVGTATGLTPGNPNGNQFAMVRYNPDGTLDTTFGTAGIVTTLLGVGNSAYTAVLQPDRKLVVGGGGGGDQTGKGGGAVLARYALDVTTTPTTTTTTTAPPSNPVPVIKSGYWLLTSDSQVYGFGDASDLGGTTRPDAVHIEPSPTGGGYWILSADGTVTPHGDAEDFGRATVPAGEHAVSLSATPGGNGYWIFTDKGRAITMGDAQFFGDMSGTRLNGAVLGSVATPSGNGYWMVASDGGIFTFGDAKFHGSTGDVKLNQPVMAMAPAANGSGYWLVASDGGVFAFDVPFYGSMGATRLNKPISGMVPGRAGYMMVGEDGGIFSFGDVAFHGSLGGNPPSKPVVSVALQP
jgi:uncharacterized delta-60 repeat protein